MKIVLVTLIVGIFCSACSFSRHWNGSSLSRDSHASFVLFSGKQTLKMKLDPKAEATKINYGFQLEHGRINMVVKYKNKEVINLTSSTVVEDSIQIKNTDDLNVEVILIGKKASGSYHIKLTNTR